jgi:glycosyltransferase involved in cell wall biosynthesis
VLEAMACGLPVVVGSLPVFRAMTADGGGVAVEDPSPESVADAIRSVVKGGAYQEMARRAHETALLYSLDCWSERIAEILAERWGRYGFRARYTT